MEAVDYEDQQAVAEEARWGCESGAHCLLDQGQLCVFRLGEVAGLNLGLFHLYLDYSRDLCAI